MKLYISAQSPIVSDTEITVKSFVQEIQARNQGYLESVLSKIQGRNIPLMRQFLHDVFSSTLLEEDDFWYLTTSLLKYDRRTYRKPIADAVISDEKIASFKCPDTLFDNFVKIMLQDEDKVLDGLRFLSVFKGAIKESHYPTLIQSSYSIAQPEGFKLLYEILGLSTEGKIDLACKVASVPALYSLYLELLAAEEKYGIWHIQGIPNFPDRLNDLPDTFEVQLIFDLIERDVLHEDIEDTTGALAEVEKDGFAAFSKMSVRYNAKAANRRNIKAIGSYLGTTIKCKVDAKYERHYLVHTTGRFSMPGLLPLVLINQHVSIRDVIQCKVVSIVKNQKLLLLSQKHCTKAYIESIPVLTIGNEYEAKFNLYNKKIFAEIIGYGPVRVDIEFIPRNFDYKRRHKVRVISARLATCKIEIID